ncbi:hypothetical protein HYPSUDRAFT_126627 [Hypholoma sublateritium FD-334 SS-4]|uniref:tripeptidyl-peptidase II n=1 Tax=Hypholoma sublateritium (strain FD-334 SS-4) TaxID=945553 RepID=A0A0D2PNL4_HYPSF|nr:hypothetical protein HYPSUDRAFT_126627 [Hypholoma sublateritium FD-334 SS-4]
MRGFHQLLSFFLLGTTLSLGSPSTHSFKNRETIVAPRGWTRQTVAPADHIISLRIGLHQRNFDLLEKHLYEVSDPTHSRYGEHLSKEEVEDLVAPHSNSLSAVDEWLSEFNLKEDDIARSPAKDWVVLTIPVSLAEKMLNTKYYVWKHGKTGNELVRTTSYSLPSHLDSHIEVVQPTTMFGQFKPAKSMISILETVDTAVNTAISKVAQIITGGNSNLTVDASCNTTITVTCLQQIYNAVGYVPSNSTKNSIGITGYLEQFANIEDLQTFYVAQVPAAVNSSFKFESVAGGINDQSLTKAGSEANLDVQFAFGVAYPIPGTFWSTAGRPPFSADVRTLTNTNEPYGDWLDHVLGLPDPPHSISTSYGDDEQTVPKDYAKRVCAGLAQLGVRGVSVIFSSGDYGVGDGNSDPATQECITNDGLNNTRFIPAFPASCPYVTSVGGTEHIPEVAVSRFYSGGGFSSYFPRPPYQEIAVGGFLSTLPKGLYEGLFNRCGIPDVAAQGDRYRIRYRGRDVSIGGTSASSPAFTGFVALLNDARISVNKRPLGFLNPLLYTAGIAGLNDITSGSNPGCGTNGFNATTGWDPVTGLGTPNFKQLKEIVTSPFLLL